MSCCGGRARLCPPARLTGSDPRRDRVRYCLTVTAAPPTRRLRRLVAAESGNSDAERTLESLALGAGGTAFVLIGLVALIMFRLEPAPIAGPGSIGQYTAIAAGVVAVVSFIVARMLQHLRAGAQRLRVLDYLDVAALAVAHAVIALLSWTLLADILQDAFIGADVFGLPGIVLSGAAAAVTAYLVFFSASHLDLQLLALVLAIFLVEGVLAAMLTASDPGWWKDNLSALGMTRDLSAMTFNLTLVVAGFLVTTLARYATRGIPTSHARGILAVRVSLVVVGVFLACVGIFPVDRFFFVHTAFATGMAVVFGVLVVMLPWWIPGMPRLFVALGWVFLATIALLGVYFAIGYYTLTAVELVAGVLIFSWIILFIRNAAALESDTNRP